MWKRLALGAAGVLSVGVVGFSTDETCRTLSTVYFVAGGVYQYRRDLKPLDKLIKAKRDADESYDDETRQRKEKLKAYQLWLAQGLLQLCKANGGTYVKVLSTVL